MSISRYHDVSEMPPPPRVTGDDLWERIRALWSRSSRLSSVCTPRGVQRFRSIEEANREREERTIRHMRRGSADPGGGRG